MKIKFNCPICSQDKILDTQLLAKTSYCCVCKKDIGIITTCCGSLCAFCSQNYQPTDNLEQEKKWAIEQSRLKFGLKTGKIYTIINSTLGDHFYILKREYKYGPIYVEFVDSSQNYKEDIFEKNVFFTEGFTNIE